MKCRILIILILFYGCKRINSERQTNPQVKYVYTLRNEFEYKFYRKINLYDRIGVDSIDVEDKKQITTYPYYGFKIENDKISVVLFDKEEYTENFNYKIIGDYIISTEMYKDTELNNSYRRTVKIISQDVEIDYEYLINEDYEELDGIKFKYKNNHTSNYQNNNGNYQEYAVHLDESEMKKKYPSFVKK